MIEWQRPHDAREAVSERRRRCDHFGSLAIRAEHHRRNFKERSRTVAKIVLETLPVGHRPEVSRPKARASRSGASVSTGDVAIDERGAQRIGDGMAGQFAPRRLVEIIAPPLQADQAELRLGDLARDARELDIQGVERKEGVACGGRNEQSGRRSDPDRQP